MRPIALSVRTLATLAPADSAGRTFAPDNRSRLGEYELLEEIAKGGMGTVYRARSSRTGKQVAIKILMSKAAANPVLRQRFEQEFRVASRLDHPNIVRSLGFGQAASGPYLVMELVEGESLGDKVAREGPLPPAEAVAIIVQVARALDHAHQERVIHRDVKPDNIMIAPNGTARLTDFGLVKQLLEDVDLTVPGRGLGTPNFIAPEQLANAKATDRRSDVYGLGATLYMAVTGQCPFAARSLVQVLRKKTLNELILPRQVVPAISQRLEKIILQAMHPDCGQRYGSCAELLQALTERGVTEASAAPSAKPGPRHAPRPGITPSGSKHRPEVSHAAAGSTLVERHTQPTDHAANEPANAAAAPRRWPVVAVIVLGLALGAAIGAWH
jgi:serine/threonine protein kinase